MPSWRTAEGGDGSGPSDVQNLDPRVQGGGIQNGGAGGKMPWLDSRRWVLETCKPSKMTQLEKGRDPAPTGFPSPLPTTPRQQNAITKPS